MESHSAVHFASHLTGVHPVIYDRLVRDIFYWCTAARHLQGLVFTKIRNGSGRPQKVKLIPIHLSNIIIQI